MSFNPNDQATISRGKNKDEKVTIIALATEPGDAVPAYVVKLPNGTAVIRKESVLRAPVEPTITATQLGEALMRVPGSNSIDDALNALENVVPGITSKVAYPVSE